MFHGLLANALSQIETIEALVENHELYASQQSDDRQRLIKEYAVASCVTRLYAVYEHFVESVLGDYLDAVPELIPYSQLGDGLKTEYRVGISHILSKIGNDRYGHLSYENVVRWYHEALLDQNGYRLVTEALTRHSDNLRLNTVERLLGRIDLKQFRSWITHSREICALYQESTSVWEQLDSEMRSFVQIRNDAAHGILETLEGKEILLRYCSLVRSVVSTITAYLHKNLLLKKTQVGRMRCIGRVTEIFVKPGAFVAQLLSGSELRLGMPVHFVSAGYCVQEVIDSLQIDSEAVDHAIAQQDGFEVGIKCRSLSPKHAEIYVEA